MQIKPICLFVSCKFGKRLNITTKPIALDAMPLMSLTTTTHTHNQSTGNIDGSNDVLLSLRSLQYSAVLRCLNLVITRPFCRCWLVIVLNAYSSFSSTVFSQWGRRRWRHYMGFICALDDDVARSIHGHDAVIKRSHNTRDAFGTIFRVQYGTMPVLSE